MSERRLSLAPLRPLDLELNKHVLIEASAGTGKTWAIAALYLRLLLESRLQARDILVLTFTVAATAELRARILARLIEARDVLSGKGRGDEFLQELAGRSANKATDALWLTAAIENFDLAPIYTIHAFCQRALAEHAFESGAPFEAELVEDDRALIESAVLDCWRIDMHTANPFWAQWLRAQDFGQTTRQVVELCRRKGKRNLPVAARETLEGEYEEALARVREAWKDADCAFESIAASTALKKNSYSKSSLPKQKRRLGEGLRNPFDAEWPDIERLTPAGLRANLNNSGGAAPEHSLFDALATWHPLHLEMQEAYRARYARWLVDMADRVGARLQAHKRERRLQSYDDWLRELDEALRGPAGDSLAQTLRRRYRAALIDEFQDTDPRQYRIFERIYRDGDAPLFFVGDPKQAIYSFRGADVYAYLEAREDAAEGFTLNINRRSQPELVRAVNALFTLNPRPFVDDRIAFLPVGAVEPSRVLRLTGDEGAAPLQCRFLARAEGERQISKERARELAATGTAEEIARLIAASARGEARLGDAPLAGSDIAVLVRDGFQARQVRNALAARGIASVTYGDDNIYCSPDAVATAQVLRAIAEPTREDLLRAALATEMLGHDASQLCSLQADQAQWAKLRERYAGYERMAREAGFIRMWRALMADENVSARLLAMPDGERRMTNMRQLADLLHIAAENQGLDLDGLLRHLERQAAEERTKVESHQLRLESDENLVRVLTVHTAKGLEFPIVFCPFLWYVRHDSDKSALIYFHDAAGEVAFDLGSTEYAANHERAIAESRAEELRLAYVALTRAEHRCVFFWGAVNQADESPLAWLLHGSGAESTAQLAELFKTLSDVDLRAALDRLAAQHPRSFGSQDYVEANAQSLVTAPSVPIPALHPRSYKGAPPRPWRVSSFSGLLLPQDREAPDYDALPIADSGAEDAPPEHPLMALPGGVRVGTMVHRLFEETDFRGVRADKVEDRVLRTLEEFDFDPAWSGTLQAMLADVVATPLDTAGLRLCDIASRRRLVEMEFLFPVGESSLPELREALQPLRAIGSHLPDAIGSTILAPGRGFIRGFIDLVFEARGRYYVADYKSNRLGTRYEDYAPPRLAEAMSESWYDLQYLLYTLALHRHLRACVEDYAYDTHFGGVYYLFVRGMAPARGADSGVYFARPDAALIDALDEALRSEERLFS